MSRKYLGKRSKTIVFKDQFSILDPIDRGIEAAKYNNLTPSNFGIDIWNAYEFSYLDKDLNPHLNVLEIIIPSTSEKTVESKSMKLYLNSFYARSFINKQHILKIIEADLSNICNASVSVTFKKSFSKKPKLCIDKIYSSIKNKFNLKKITVYGRFMRRGGIDINPIRSSSATNKFNNHREFSQ